MGLLDRFKRQPRTSGQPSVESGRGHDLILGSRFGARAGLVQPDEYKAELTGQRGFKVFEQMFRSDPDVFSRYMMLGSPFVGATWDVQAYGGKTATATAQKHADFVKWCLFERMDPGLHAHLMAAWRILRFGIAPFEQVFAWDEWRGERQLVVEQLHLILPRTVWDWPSRGERLERLILANNDGSKIEIDATDLVYYRLGAEGDNWEGTAEDPDTPVPTLAGWSRMGDLRPGDKVFDEQGAPCNVVGTREWHDRPCYEVRFDSGESIVADANHR